MSVISQLSGVKGLWSWHRFERTTKEPEEVQRHLLQRILKTNRDTEYGRAHGFSRVVSVEDFRESVPIGDFEAIRPWIDRLKEGQSSVLTAQDPYMFNMTSGTTGEPKLIPAVPTTGHMTKELSRLWIYRCLVDHSKVLDHKALAIVSPAIEGYTESGIPFGSASGNIYRSASWLIRRRYAVPYPVFTIKDYNAKYYTIMRFAIEQRVSFMATPNPSTILRLLTTANAHREQLLRDIHDGSIARELEISQEVRDELDRGLNPNPERARALEKIVDDTGALMPGDYWPDLVLIGSWKGGSVGSTVERLRPWFRRGMPIRDIGYLSSESSVTVPIEDEGCRGIPALGANFLEFVPEAEMDSGSPRVLTVGELESGQSYYILITSSNGLYRYDINDVVRVAGYYNRTPMLEFMRKGRDMVNLEGEKLHVSQLIQAVDSAKASLGVELEYFRAVGRVEESRYLFQLEFKERQVPDTHVIRFAQAIDQELSGLNIEYEQKRGSGRLLSPIVGVMAAGWSTRRLEDKLASAVRDTQFKDELLSLDEDSHEGDLVKELTT